MREAILFFVKFPEPGRVKTRLAATVGPEEATRVYRRLVEAVCARLPADAFVIAMFDPPDKREAILQWLAPLLPRGAHFAPQSSGDLGERLTAAFALAFTQGCERAAAIGSDCIEISPATFQAAWSALETHDIALGPADDGGYYLIALNQPSPALFRDIPWSTRQTLAATIRCAEAGQQRPFLLPRLRDVDTEEDWRTARAQLDSASAPPMKTVPSPMKLTAPLIFEPLFMERIWGGRRLETLFGKRLPATVRVGESWEIVDRPEAQSVVHAGVLRGKTLHELWVDHREAVFGAAVPDSERFPLLIKLLDAQERLSVQVHPPARMAAALEGEPKTEMWYFADTHGESDIFAGLKRGVSRDEFAQALRDGAIADKVHRIVVQQGDAIFIPSGRIHAIGAGNVIVEVQQNSDTTYRVFDWNRIALDGKSRELHLEQSMASIDFDDFEPALAQLKGEIVTACEFFVVEKWQLAAPREAALAGKFAIFACLEGEVECGGVRCQPGEFFLVPAEMENREIKPAAEAATVLRTSLP